MAIQTKDKSIEGRLYQFILPPPTVCLPICNRAVVILAPVLSGGLGQAVTAAIQGKTVTEKIKALLGPALISIVSSLSKTDPVATNELMMEVVQASHICCNGKPIFNSLDFDTHFGEHRSDTYPVMTWVLWECVKDFFPKWEGSPLPALKETAMSAFLSRMAGQPSTGSDVPAGKDSVDTES